MMLDRRNYPVAWAITVTQRRKICNWTTSYLPPAVADGKVTIVAGHWMHSSDGVKDARRTGQVRPASSSSMAVAVAMALRDVDSSPVAVVRMSEWSEHAPMAKQTKAVQLADVALTQPLAVESSAQLPKCCAAVRLMPSVPIVDRTLTWPTTASLLMCCALLVLPMFQLGYQTVHLC